jgi:hydroxyacylglutathione hydrolase
MFVEKVKTAGLAHLSYVIGSAGEAAVVDPRRDCAVYIELAAAQNCRITHIFETHRNEDLVSGASALSALTGAAVYHGPNPADEVVYASTAVEGDEFSVGKVRLRALETPGHTDDSLSFALYDTDFGEQAVAVFTGDALFVGDVGRTDFYPDRAREVAGLLYDSLQKILQLGDQAIVYPAHGAGSVCGSGMADRELSTLGYERMNNPRLQIEQRDAFIEAKISEHHLQPPYFRHMEELNLSGASPVRHPLAPAPLTSQRFKELRQNCVLVDVRSASSFLGAHLPDSLALPVNMISAFAGWLLEPGDELILVATDAEQASLAALHLARIGYDRIQGFLAPSLAAWAAAGEAFGTLPVVDARTVRERRRETHEGWTLLDVRDEEEFAQVAIPGARHLYVGELPGKLAELDPQRAYTVMCGSGARATIAASVLLRAGFDKVDLFLGSMGAWKSIGFSTE